MDLSLLGNIPASQLIMEQALIREAKVSVDAPAGNQHLIPIVLSNGQADVIAKCARMRSSVYDAEINRSLKALYQLPANRIPMEAPKDVFPRLRKAICYKSILTPNPILARGKDVIIMMLTVAFEVLSSKVREIFWLENKKVFYLPIGRQIKLVCSH